MPYQDYIQHTDNGLASQMITFRDNIQGELAALGLLATDEDIVQQALDATRFRAIVDFNATMQQAAMGWTAEKNFERDGGSPGAASQNVPVLPKDFPAAVPPGILARFRYLAQRIKGLKTYTIAIGQTLGLEGISAVSNAVIAGTAQPVARGPGTGQRRRGNRLHQGRCRSGGCLRQTRWRRRPHPARARHAPALH
jgi:hypothetical protein